MCLDTSHNGTTTTLKTGHFIGADGCRKTIDLAGFFVKAEDEVGASFLVRTFVELHKSTFDIVGLRFVESVMMDEGRGLRNAVYDHLPQTHTLLCLMPAHYPKNNMKALRRLFSVRPGTSACPCGAIV
jgi:hypothetical protein